MAMAHCVERRDAEISERASPLLLAETRTKEGEEMRRISVLLAVIAIMLVGVVPATAGPKTEASGDWKYIPAITDVKVAGPNMFLYGTDDGTWTGTFVGTSVEEFLVICHPKAGFAFYKGEMTYDGYVLDAAGAKHDGAMVIKTRGKQVTDTCGPSPAIWNGRWVIIGGTGGLADVHGHGTFWGPSTDLDYGGQVHFS